MDPVHASWSAMATAWDRVDPRLQAYCKHLGITTMWSALDWNHAIMVAVEVEIDRRHPTRLNGGLGPGEIVVEAQRVGLARARLREELIDLVAGLGLSKLEEIATLASVDGRLASVVEIIATILRWLAPTVKTTAVGMTWLHPGDEAYDALCRLAAKHEPPAVPDDPGHAPRSRPIGGRLLRKLGRRR